MERAAKKGSLEIWEDKWVPTTCGMCYACCAIKVRVVNGVAVQIDGNPDSYFGARGGVCGKALAALQILYDPYRVNYPLKRTNPKKGIGEDPKWKRITWKEATDEIVEKFGKLLKEEPQSVSFTGSPTSGFDPPVISTRFSIAFGGIRSTIGPTQCGNASHEYSGMNHCSWSICPDFQYCNYALIFGAGKGVSSGHSMAMLARLRAEATARGMKTVAFDPVCHQQGGKSTEWVPLLPGTDLAVALSIANMLVNELKVYDREYLADKTNASYMVKADGRYVRDEHDEPMLWDVGAQAVKPWNDPDLGETTLEGEYEVQGENCRPVFSVLKEHLKQYTPEWASEISTVPSATLRRIAKEYAENARIGSTIEIDGETLPYRPVACVQFRGGMAHSNGAHTYMAIDLLNQLMGSSEVPGGCIGWVARSLGHPETGMPKFEPKATKDGFLTSSSWNPGLPATWPHTDPEVQNRPTLVSLFTMSTSDTVMGSRVEEDLHQKLGITSRIKATLCLGANPAMNTADPESAAKWLGKIPFFVHYQIYPNETSEGFADIVLPDTCQLEALDVLSSEMYHFHYPVGMQPMEYHVRQPVVKPMYERRDMREFLLELAERLGIQKEYYDQLNKPPIMTGCTPPLDREKTYTWEEVVNQYLVSKFGPDNDLEAVSKKGFVQWPKRVEEAYWRPYIKARSMIYMEFLIEHAEKLKAIISPRGIELDWRAYTPLISFFPAAPHKVEDSEFDLFAFSYRDVLFAGTHCQGLPWLRECAGMNPFSEMICMNKKTAQKKGIKEGDTIYLENTIGKKAKGKVHLIEGIHPQCVASVSHAGKWSNAQPIGKGKAPFFTALLQNDFEHWCPVTLNPEGSAKVKAIKAGDIK